MLGFSLGSYLRLLETKLHAVGQAGLTIWGLEHHSVRPGPLQETWTHCGHTAGLNIGILSKPHPMCIEKDNGQC